MNRILAIVITTVMVGLLQGCQDFSDNEFAEEQIGTVFSQAATIAYTKPEEALLLTDRVVAMARRDHNLEYEGRAYLLQGNIHYSQDQLKQSFRAYTQASYLFEESNHQARWIESRLGIAMCYRKAERFDECERIYQEVEPLLQEQGQREKLGLLYYRLGSSRYYQQDHHSAKYYFKKALGYTEELGNRLKVLVGLTGTYVALNETEAFLDLVPQIERLLPALQSSRSLYYKGMLRHNQGVMESMDRDMMLAEAYLKEALAVRKQVGDVKATMNTLNELAELAIKQNRHEEAMAWLSESILLGQPLLDKARLIVAYELKAKIQEQQGNFKAANETNKLIKSLMEMVKDSDYENALSRRKTEVAEAEAINIWSSMEQQMETKFNRQVTLIISIAMVLLFGLLTLWLRTYQTVKRLSKD